MTAHNFEDFAHFLKILTCKLKKKSCFFVHSHSHYRRVFAPFLAQNSPQQKCDGARKSTFRMCDEKVGPGTRNICIIQ